MIQRPLSIVVHVNGGDFTPTAANATAAPDEQSSATLAFNPGLDPYQLHRDFPAMWSAYLHEAFAGPRMTIRIALSFDVDESTARAWLKGQGGCRGHHVVQAMRHAPDLAMTHLFHMAAE